MRIVIFIASFLIIHVSVWAQLSDADKVYFTQQEDSLRKWEQRVFFSKNESNRFAANKQFIALWNEVLKHETSLQYSFDSLKELSMQWAPDHKFRLMTWNIFKEDGTHAFFGYLQVNNSKTIKKGLFKKETIHQYDVFQLVDKSATVKNPENYVSDASKWFGMLYYDVIKSDGDYYTLLGWDGNDQLTQRKFIDILSFKEDGTPVFGKDVFKIPNKFVKRVMFEYAGEVSMSLKYNKNRQQLIFNHLAPKNPDPTLEGQYQYYGPDGSFDALYMKKGKWVYEPAIDIRKEKDKNDDVKKPDPSKQIPVYKPK